MKNPKPNRELFFNALATALLVIFAVLTPSKSVAQETEQPPPTLSHAGNESWEFTWQGVQGRTYFVQYSYDLMLWQYYPVIETGYGYGYETAYSFDSSADRIFLRLQYTDIPTYDPYYDDFDGDGLSNYNEIVAYSQLGSIQASGINPSSRQTDPLNPDTDGDGASDGVERSEGTDPNSATSVPSNWWERATRSLQYDFDEYPPPTGNRGWLSKYSEWDASLNTYEELTARIPFTSLRTRLENIAFPDDPPQSGGGGLTTGWGYSSLLPDPPCYHASMAHHRYWFRRSAAAPTAFSIRAIRVLERTTDGTAEPMSFVSTTVTIPANETASPPTDLVEGFTKDWSDNQFHSESYTHTLCPLELVQANMPNVTVAENSTDLGGQRASRLIGIGGTAFITGQPAMAQLRAKFRNMPASVSIDWRLEIRSERTERGTLDDRNFPTTGWVTLAGDAEWDITAAMNGEFVGGNCTLHYRINGGNAGSVTFRLRGKNPLDADARARITASVGADFAAYAWAMAQHESRQGNRVYNQFNTQATIEGTLNFGGPNGWGVCQIDRARPPDDIGVSTAEVWNWHQNVAAMQAKLLEKQTTYRRFIGYFRDSYGTQSNWSEPPAAHTEGTTTLPAEAWGVMVLYNGAGGVPLSTTPTRPSPPFQSPWVFNPTTGVWTFYDNQNNYAAGPTRVRPELEQTTNIQE